MTIAGHLRPYGHIVGTAPDVWCATCGRLSTMHAKSFKCLPCATTQHKAVERELEVCGPLPVNRVPGDKS